MRELIGAFFAFLEVQTALVAEFYGGYICYGRSSKDETY